MILTPQIGKDLESILIDICANRGLEVVSHSILLDHVHLLLKKNDNDSNEYVMKVIKGSSACRLFRKHPSDRSLFRKLWSRGYRAKTIKDQDHLLNVVNYIDHQKIDGVDKRSNPNWKPRRLVAGFLLILLLTLPIPVNAVTIYTMSGEADDAPPPQREIVGTYENFQGRAKSPEMRSKIVRIKYISIDKAVETISRVIPNLIVVKNDDSNSIILRGEAPDVNDAARLLDSLDKKVPQILIEGKVVEVSQSGLSDIGIVWGDQQGSFKFSVDKSTGGISQTDNVAGELDALIASGKAKLIANPKITALDRKEAEINIGSRVPYAVPSAYSSTYAQWTVQYIDAGVNLKILPSVAGDGTIVSTIIPEVSNISEWRTTAAGEFPVISTRNASVTVRLKDGETLVIGGLINESDRENVSGIPFLSDMPFIGWLFQHREIEKTKTDVIFLITPHIMK